MVIECALVLYALCLPEIPRRRYSPGRVLRTSHVKNLRLLVWRNGLVRVKNLSLASHRLAAHLHSADHLTVDRLTDDVTATRGLAAAAAAWHAAAASSSSAADKALLTPLTR